MKRVAEKANQKKYNYEDLADSYINTYEGSIQVSDYQKTIKTKPESVSVKPEVSIIPQRSINNVPKVVSPMKQKSRNNQLLELVKESYVEVINENGF